MKNNGAQLELLSSSGGGAVAMRLLQSGFNVNALRPNDLLRKDEWIMYDTAVVAVARQRLNAISEFLSRGLSMPLPNALGVTQIQWETISDMTEAELTMSGLPTSERDRVNYELSTMPIPIVHKDFQLNIRALEASRKTGQPLDTTQAELATRLVAEKLESMVFTGAPSIVFGGSQVYGLRNHPNRNTGSVAANWDSAATGANYLADIIAAIGKAQADRMWGPYGVFVTYSAYQRMMDDFKADSDKTILQRLMEVPDIAFIKPNENVNAGGFVLVQLSSETIRMVDGIQPTMIMWESHGGFLINFKIIAIMVPQVRATQTTQSGVVHYS